MLSPNTVLRERYRIIHQLGHGGMGAVYQAMDENLSCLVAVKETFATNDEQRRAFRREAELLANLTHPTLPRVTDHFTDGEGQFLVMQFVPGHDLAELLELREQPFAVAKVLDWADQILDALEELHSSNPPIVHRDIKPSNLKATPKGRILLLDFGLAKGAAGQMSTADADASQRKSIYGYTPNYAPIEQIRGAGTDPRSDLYALGATLWTLLTARIPPDAVTRMAEVGEGNPDPLPLAHEINRQVPASISNALHRALAVHRNQRYESASELRKALRAAADEEVEQPTSPREEKVLPKPVPPFTPSQDPTIRSPEPPSPPATPPVAPTIRSSEPDLPPPVSVEPQAETMHVPSPPVVPSWQPASPSPTVPTRPGQVNQQKSSSSTKAIVLTLVAAVIVGIAVWAIFATHFWESTPEDKTKVGSLSDESTREEYVVTGYEGAITGTIRYLGPAPEKKLIDTSTDGACTLKSGGFLELDDWVVRDGRVANTLVYLKNGTLANGKGIAGYLWGPPPSPVSLDQAGCHFSPRVLAVMVNQEIRITNSDPTNHNVHFMPENSQEFNESQPNGSPALTQKLTQAEVMIPVKCNQHPWMKAYIGVMKHPFFAVSATDGSFTIRGVPPGTYTVAAWHEGPGSGTEKTMEVTVPQRGAATADFYYGGRTEMRGQPSSLKLLPAIEFPAIH